MKILAVLPFLALASLFSTANAQSPLEPFDTRIRPWPSGLPAGPFGRFLAGDVSGMPGREVVGLRGSSLFVASDPSAFDGVQEVDATLTNVADLAIVPISSHEPHDGILSVDPVNGLLLHTYDFVSGQFTATGLDPSWTDVTRLAVGDLDGDGSANDIAGTWPLGMLTLIHDGTQYAPGPSHLSTWPITDVEIVDYDGNGAADVALLTEAGLSVVPLSGVPFPFVPAPTAEGIITALPSGSGHDLVWCMPTGGTWYLFIQDSSGRGPVVPLTFAPSIGQPKVSVDVVDVVPVDIDVDGSMDLFVCQRTLPTALFLMNGGGATFSNADDDVGRIELLINPNDMASNGATAAAFTHAEDQSWIYYPLDSHDGVFTALGQDETAPFPVGDLALEFFHTLSDDQVLIEFTEPTGTSVSINGAQLTLFGQCEVTDAVDGDALANVVCFFPEGPPAPRYRAVVDLPSTGCPADDPIWHIALRFVEGERDGSKVHIADATRIVTLAARYGDRREELMTLPTWIEYFDINADGTAGPLFGGVVLLDEVPIFDGPPRVPRPIEGPQLIPWQ